MTKISIIGSGGWGCALAALLANKGHEVMLWSWQKEESEDIARHRENKLCLPGISLPDSIRYTYSLEEAADAQLYVFAVPSQAVLSTAKSFSAFAKAGVPIVDVAKGFEGESLKRLSEVISEACPANPVAALSGPSHAEEVARAMPTTVVAACEDAAVSAFVQDVFMTDSFRIYTHDDIIGVELGGALKNIIALCVGISDGLGLGDNTKAAIMTRGIAEISRLGTAMGANASTFAGLSGIGDLIVTCTSIHSRNYRAGRLIGRGKSASEAADEVKTVVEGINAAKAAKRLADKYEVQMPIISMAYQVLFEEKSAEDAVSELMNRERRSEMSEHKAQWL